jgi:hypothetical protein
MWYPTLEDELNKISGMKDEADDVEKKKTVVRIQLKS